MKRVRRSRRVPPLRSVRLGLALGFLVSMTQGDPLFARQESGGTPPSDGPLAVTVFPNTVEGREKILGEFLDGPDYDTATHGRLALSIATLHVNAGNPAAAEDTIEDAISHIEDHAQGGRHGALAVLNDAMAYLVWQDGDYKKRIRYLLRTVEAVKNAYGEDDQLVGLARLRLVKAYLEAHNVSPRSSYLSSGIRFNKDLIKDSERSLGATHPIALMAKLSMVSFDVAGGQFGTAEKRIDEVIETAETGGARTLRFKAMGLLLKARLFQARGKASESERLLAQAAEILPADGTDVLAFDAETDLLDERTRFNAQAQRATPGNSGGASGVFSASNLPQSSGVGRADFASEQAGFFVDVSFCIASDGSVKDLTVLSSNASETWISEALQSVAERRYIVSDNKTESDECVPKMEKLSVMSDKRSVTGSRVKMRSPVTTLISESLSEGIFRTDYLPPVGSEDGDLFGSENSGG